MDAERDTIIRGLNETQKRLTEIEIMVCQIHDPLFGTLKCSECPEPKQGNSCAKSMIDFANRRLDDIAVDLHKIVDGIK